METPVIQGRGPGSRLPGNTPTPMRSPPAPGDANAAKPGGPRRPPARRGAGGGPAVLVPRAGADSSPARSLLPAAYGADRLRERPPRGLPAGRHAPSPVTMSLLPTIAPHAAPQSRGPRVPAGLSGRDPGQRPSRPGGRAAGVAGLGGPPRGTREATN